MTVSITFSHDDEVSARWTGIGGPLTHQQANEDFYNIKTAVETLQDNFSLTISIATVTQPSPSSMRVTLTDATFFDLSIPLGAFRDRGNWAVSTVYLVNDTFNAPDGGLYRVIFDHTSSATSFDPNANDGSGHDYYAAMIPARGNAFPAGGVAGMYLRKNSSTDYDFDPAYIQATEVVFSPSTASALTSDNVADALEELEGLIASVTVDASDVTFTPSTGSPLTSTNVADALEELEANISAPVGYLPLSGGTMTGTLTLAGDPASALQAATKQYVDGIALNLGKRQTVRVATTANIVIASGLNSGDTIDGVTLATNDLVLVKNQTTAAQNGVYVVDVSPVRSVEFDTYNEHPGALIAVQEGTVNADTIWLCTANAGGTLNTTPITFSQSSSSGALLASNNLSDIPNKASARSALDITLAHCGDVNVTEGAGINGYFLKWDNATSKWVASLSGATAVALSGLSDVNVTEGAGIDGDYLRWDNGTSKWVADALAAVANSGAYGDLSGTPSLGTIAAFNETTAAQYQANTSGKALSTDKVWGAADLVALTDASTIAVDMSTFLNASVTLGGNRTLGNPSNTKNGQTGVIKIAQDGTGSRTLAYSSNWKFAGGTAPTLTTTASAVDLLFYQVISSTFIYATLIKDVK